MYLQNDLFYCKTGENHASDIRTCYIMSSQYDIKIRVR